MYSAWRRWQIWFAAQHAVGPGAAQARQDTWKLLMAGEMQGISCGLWAATLGWILIRIINGAGRNFVAAIIIVAAYLSNIGINLLTSYIPHSAQSGTLLLGLGEAVRGIVLLAGVMMVLKSRKKLLYWLFLASIPAFLMVLLGCAL